MSTKIYHGYKMDSCSLEELRNFAISFRAKVEEAFKHELFEIAAEQFASLVDSESVPNLLSLDFAENGIKIGEGTKAWGRHFLLSELLLKKTKKAKKSDYRDPTWDFDCIITVLPTKTDVLMMLHCDKDAASKALLSMPGVRKYPYWDNTDQPKGMTYEEWKERGREWDEALKLGGGIPLKSGMSIDVGFDPWMALMLTKEHRQIIVDLANKTYPDRCKSAASDALWPKFKEQDKEADDKDFHKTMRVYMRFKEWLRSNEGQAALGPEIERAKNNLRSDLTDEDFTAEIIANIS